MGDELDEIEERDVAAAAERATAEAADDVEVMLEVEANVAAAAAAASSLTEAFGRICRQLQNDESLSSLQGLAASTRNPAFLFIITAVTLVIHEGGKL